MSERMEKLLASMEASGLDAMFISKQANQRYIEGFTGNDCYLMASKRGNFLFADSRYTEMARRDCPNVEIVPHRHPYPPLEAVVAKTARDLGFGKLGFEGAHLTYDLYDVIAEELSRENIEMVSVPSIVEKIRARKEPEEIEKIAAACRTADLALEGLIKTIKHGVSELALKTELDYRLKTCGADDTGFDAMVLFGARASQPHANSSREAKLAPGDFILIDYGAMSGGYRSDTTRTFIFGKASAEQKRAYETVLFAQRESAAMLKKGANGRDVNDKALGIIKGAGFPAFDYGIGHGVGLEIHEEPFMRQNADVILEAGNVLTVEPGIYSPGWGGIRIEDTILVTEGGYEILTSFPKELIEIEP
jgi:Xaa-Pro aminopeptidase